ncbi:FtsX-like permease family protein [Dactylosporangium sp. NBC_01737]|uniref:ABC transporter permease n=1 Tax=Dactylosporangium sp. NBC_01737 TaxID=2975959 RepID=UPI002E152FDF|nr:FtsX-like permease family protein [Dactylosporangium sp. NBC_01737]
MLRATLKSLLARKLRLILSTLAVVLSVMFVSGSLVLTDTLGRTFDNVFSNIYSSTDVQVTAKSETANDASGNPAVALPMPAADVERVAGVAGVRKATGAVFVTGARVVGKNGKIVVSQSGQFGGSWNGEDETTKLIAGAAPSAADEVVINNGLAKQGKFAVGDAIDVIARSEARKTYKVAGIMQYTGNRDSMAGETTVLFTVATAQQAMLGETGVFNLIDVKGEAGVSDNQLRDNVKAALGPSYVVQTGEELSKESSEAIRGLLKYFNYFFLGFGAIALLVGVFLILNTFSIIVSQRTQELALLRAMGASRWQIIRSVLIEALLIGIVGSLFGFLVGMGLGALGASAFTSLAKMDSAGLGLPVAAIVTSFTIGILVTMISAVLPAIKAARVAPIAAMRDAAATDKPLTGITIAGGVVTAIGVGSLSWGLAGAGSATLLLVFGGVLLTLIGVALLAPLVSRPLVAGLGAVFSWSVPGKLGRRNSSRNPRRTAITAGAVMVGIAIITMISTIFSSLSTAIGDSVEKDLQADLIIYGQQTSDVPPIIQPDELKQIKALPQLQTVASVTYDVVSLNGKQDFVLAYDDVPAVIQVLKLHAVAGRIDHVDSGEFTTDEKTAKDRKYTVGSTIQVTFAKGMTKTLTLVGITNSTVNGNGVVVSNTDAQAGFSFPQPIQALVKAKDGVAIGDAKTAIEGVLKNNPEVSVQTKEELVGSSQQQFDVALVIVQVLLFIALGISVLGVINTLLLSVIERTRELGMLRAIGLRRRQTWSMVTIESVVITLFGTVLGLVVGAGLGAATVTALKSVIGFGAVTLPWGYMIAYIIGAVIVGAVAGLIPAIRAVRLNVLNAIAYE